MSTYSSNLFLKYDKKNLISLNHDQEIIIDHSENSSRVKDMRVAAECHKYCRKMLEKTIHPNMKYTDICELIENNCRKILGDDINSGIGFPTSISLNNIIAHDGAEPKDKRIITKNDVCKIDMGTHVNGNIIDSSFTVIFDQKFKPLVDASYYGIWEGIKMAGPDAYLHDVSKSIREVVESYEIELDGKIYPIKSMFNLGGHSIEPYTLHGEKSIFEYNIANPKRYDRMKVNECYAIEIVASTGSGKMYFDTSIPCTNYIPNPKINIPSTLSDDSIKLLKYIKNKGNLPFCSRWLYQKFGENYKYPLNELVLNKIVNEYFPASDTNIKSYSSQWEHTIYLHDNGKEILSFSDDY